MAGKKRQAPNMVYYLPTASPSYNYYPPPDQHQYAPSGYNYNNTPSQPSLSQSQPQSNSQSAQNTPNVNAGEEIEQGALLLRSLRESSEFQHTPSQLHPHSAFPSERSSVSYPLRKKSGSSFQRFFVHRVGKEPKAAIYRESDARDGKEDIFVIPTIETLPEKEFEKEVNDDSNPLQVYDDNKPNTKFSNADIIFANGNNREKRRIELFENYSELYKFEERKRTELFEKEKTLLDNDLKELITPRPVNSEVSNFQEIPDLYEAEQDIIERRDFELTRLRYWRRYKRNENVKNFYKQSIDAYQNSSDVLVSKLDKLKSFFIKQRNMLNNLDKEFIDINSSRAEKFYTGFNNNKQQLDNKLLSSHEQANTDGKSTNGDGSVIFSSHLTIPHDSENGNHHLSTQESSETDTGGFTSSNSKPPKKRGPGRRRKNETLMTNNNKSKSKKQKLDNTILSSILEGFAPVLSNDEFEAVTGEDGRSGKTYIGGHLTSSLGSDTEGGNGTGYDNNGTGREGGNGTSGGGRTTTSSRAVREARDRDGYKENSTAALNKIMKQYVTPGNLEEVEVEEDLKILRSLGKN